MSDTPWTDAHEFLVDGPARMRAVFSEHVRELERELDEARKALVWAWNNASCSLAPAPDNVIAALNAARAAGGGELVDPLVAERERLAAAKGGGGE